MAYQIDKETKSLAKSDEANLPSSRLKHEKKADQNGCNGHHAAANVVNCTEKVTEILLTFDEKHPIISADIALGLLKIQSKFVSSHPCLCTSRFRHTLHQLDEEHHQDLDRLCSQLSTILKLEENENQKESVFDSVIPCVFGDVGTLKPKINEWLTRTGQAQSEDFNLNKKLSGIIGRLVTDYRAIFAIEVEFSRSFEKSDDEFQHGGATEHHRKRHEEVDNCPEEIKLMKVACEELTLECNAPNSTASSPIHGPRFCLKSLTSQEVPEKDNSIHRHPDNNHNAALEDVRSRHHHRRRAHHNVNGRSAGASTSDEKASPVVTSMKAYHHHEETDSTPVSSDVEHSQTPSPRRSCQRKRKERRDSIGEGQDKKFSKSSSDVFPTTCVIEDNEVTDGMRRVQSTVAGLLANNNQDDCCLHQKCNLPVDDHSSTKEKCTFYVSDEEAALEKTSARAVIRPRRSRKVRTDSLKENQVTPEEASIFPWKKNVPSPPPSLSTPPPDVVTTTSSAVFSLVTSVKSSNVQEYDDSSSSSTSDETIVDTEEDISFSAAVKKNSSPVQDSSQNMMNYQPAVAWEPYGTIWKDDQSTRHFGMLHSKQHLDRNHWPRNPNDSTDQETKNKIKQLSKQLSLVRKKIEEFEVKFEEAHGYRPSQAEKQSNKEIRKLILHQNRVKRQIRLFRESGDSGINLDSSSPSMSPVRSWSPACSDFSNLLNVYSDHSDDSLDKFKDSVKDIEDKLDQDRQSSGRPDSLEAMSPAQVLDEKNSIQVALNQVQQVLSKSPNDNEGRTLLKDLLVRYRSVKRLVRRSTNVLIKDPSELETIPEGSEIQLTLASPQHRINIEMNSKMMDSNGNASEFIEPLVGGAVEMDEQQVNALHDMSRSQLLNVQKVAKEEKKQLRRWLKEREFKFQETNGRAMPKDEVKAHDIYNKYKMTKAKLKLVDALLSKQKNSP